MISKSDLKNGAVIELRNGMHFFKMDDLFIVIDSTSLLRNFYGFIRLNNYNNNLDIIDSNYQHLDIMKIDNDVHVGNEALKSFLDHKTKWTWQREETIELTEEEVYMLRILQAEGYNYIFKDLTDHLIVDSCKPVRCDEGTCWSPSVQKHWYLKLETMFKFIKWNHEPYYIKELLKGYQE